MSKDANQVIFIVLTPRILRPHWNVGCPVIGARFTSGQVRRTPHWHLWALVHPGRPFSYPHPVSISYFLVPGLLWEKGSGASAQKVSTPVYHCKENISAPCCCCKTTAAGSTDADSWISHHSCRRFLQRHAVASAESSTALVYSAACSIRMWPGRKPGLHCLARLLETNCGNCSTRDIAELQFLASYCQTDLDTEEACDCTDHRSTS